MNSLSEAVDKALSETGRPSELARAKINLALHVIGRRADGFHNIDSLVVFADVGDVLTAETAEPGRMSLRIDGAFATALSGRTGHRDNLVIRAAEALAKLAPDGLGSTKLALTKRIPVAAGLGGGSADAAATLHLLNRMWKLGLSADALAGAGIKLGADVPMCLHARPLVASGMGEKITTASGIPALPLVLAFPGGGLPTASVFAALDDDQDRAGLPPLPSRFDSLLDFVFWLRQTRNDLANPAAEVSSLARAAAGALNRDPDSLFARMSGSGTSAFGIFLSLRAADRAAARTQADHPYWWVVATMSGAG